MEYFCGENQIEMSFLRVYFDNAASTPLRPEVIEEINKSFTIFGNPSSPHHQGQEARAMMENIRKKIAVQLSVSASEIVFTSGGAEGNNMILQSAVRDLGVTQIITTKAEHHSVLETLNFLQTNGLNVSYLSLNENGEISLEELEGKLTYFSDNENVMVSLMHINNEIGTILPIEKVADLCYKYKAYFHSDMVQSMGHYWLNLSEIKVDFITASAHKFYGPKGVGFVYIRKNLGIKSLIFGGEQERGLRGGTQPFHSIIGLGKAFEMAYQNLEKERKYLKDLKQYFVDKLRNEIPQIKFNANSHLSEKNAYSLINIQLPVISQKVETIFIYLDIKGIACSRGSACQSGGFQKSSVLASFLSEKELKNANIRFSFSIFNTKQEVDYVCKILKNFIEK